MSTDVRGVNVTPTVRAMRNGKGIEGQGAADFRRGSDLTCAADIGTFYY